MVAKCVLTDDEYWEAQTMSNAIPFSDRGDEIDNLINGFEHGVVASRKVSLNKNKQQPMTTFIGFDGKNGNNGNLSRTFNDEMFSVLYFFFF